jgi:hypothetical protein
MEIGFPMHEGPEDHEDLIMDFVDAREAIVDVVHAEDIVNQVFLGD